VYSSASLISSGIGFYFSSCRVSNYGTHVHALVVPRATGITALQNRFHEIVRDTEPFLALPQIRTQRLEVHATEYEDVSDISNNYFEPLLIHLSFL
jgi:hypothetical protein